MSIEFRDHEDCVNVLWMVLASLMHRYTEQDQVFITTRR